MSLRQMHSHSSELESEQDCTAQQKTGHQLNIMEQQDAVSVIKMEVESHDEADHESSCGEIESVFIKEEVLEDERTNEEIVSSPNNSTDSDTVNRTIESVYIKEENNQFDTNKEASAYPTHFDNAVRVKRPRKRKETGKVSMATVTKKRKALSVEEKVKVIREIENGRKKADVCREFGLVNSTIQTIWKNRTKIVSAFEESGSQIKRFRKPERSDVDEALLKWFKQQRADSVPIRGSLLMIKAEEFAKRLSDEEFVCSAGWVDRFKLRHNISFGKLSSEARGVNSDMTTEWLTAVWPSMREGYADSDIFKAAEAGIFFRLTPDMILKFKGEKCVGGKLSKDRITVLVCANVDGTEKRKLLVIGKSKNPRCLKNVKSLPVRYRANPKAWMTSDLFEAELRHWNRELRLQKRKILLLVDNCPAHTVLEKLENIKLVFLPANSTSVLKPIDQGMTRSLKCHYRKLMLLRMIDCIEKKQVHAMTLLDAIRCIEKAWRRVTDRTIRRCFCHAGILLTQGANINEKEDRVTFEVATTSAAAAAAAAATADADDLPLSEWVQKFGCDVGHYDYDAYATIDDDIVTTEAQTDEDIVKEIRNRNGKLVPEEEEEEEEGEGKEEKPEVPIPTVSEALEAIRVVNRFYEAKAGNSKIVSQILDIEEHLENLYWTVHRRQMKIADFLRQT